MKILKRTQRLNFGFILCIIVSGCSSNVDDVVFEETEEEDIVYGEIVAEFLQGYPSTYEAHVPFNPTHPDDSFSHVAASNGNTSFGIQVPLSIQQPGEYTMANGLKASYFRAGGNYGYISINSTPESEITLTITLINENIVEGTFSIDFNSTSYPDEACDIYYATFSVFRE